MRLCSRNIPAVRRLPPVDNAYLIGTLRDVIELITTSDTESHLVANIYNLEFRKAIRLSVPRFPYLLRPTFQYSLQSDH